MGTTLLAEKCESARPRKYRLVSGSTTAPAEMSHEATCRYAVKSIGLAEKDLVGAGGSPSTLGRPEASSEGCGELA